MKKLIMLLLSAVLVALCVNGAANAQVVDQVTFNGVESSAPTSPELEERSFTVVNSGDIGAIIFRGTIKALEPITFALDHRFDVSGAGINVEGVQFTTETNFGEVIEFVGFVETVGQITAGDNLTFNFFDTFNNANAVGANALIDVTFEFIGTTLAELTKTNLGDFVLDQGFYDRGLNNGGVDHPYRAIEFEVSDDGLYSIESVWDDGVGEINSFDGFLYLFDGVFDGVDDTGNIALNDDSGNNIGASKIGSLFLQKGIKYTVLLTSFDAEAGNDSLRGQLNVVSLEGNSAFLVEEPAAFKPELLFPILFLLLEEG